MANTGHGFPRLAGALLVSAVLGAGAALLLFSPAFLRGQSAYFLWPRNDIEMFMTGGTWFIHEPWRFPLFLTDMIARPSPQSLAMTDCVPLMALVAKLIFSATGHEIAFLAWWYALTVIMQPIGFTLLLWAGGVRSRLVLALGAILSLLVPAWLYRLGHTALFSHFVITIAMTLCFESWRQTRVENRWRSWLLIAWPAWLSLAVTVNLYLACFTLAFFVVALGEATLADVKAGRTQERDARALYAAGAVASAALTMYAFGFFVPYAGSGSFGYYSMNLLSSFVPQNTDLFPGSLRIIDATGGQYEGYNYFGAGFFALCAVALAAGDKKPLREAAERPILLLALLALFLFALSTQAYVGGFKLWSLPALHVFENFRSSGRFVWPLTYFALFLVLAALDRPAVAKFWTIAPVLLLCVALQGFDARHLLERVFDAGHRIARPAMNSDPDLLRALVARHEGVAIAPDFGCLRSPALNELIQDFGWQAARTGKPVTSTYTARFPVDLNCDIDPDKLRAKRDAGWLVATLHEDGQTPDAPDLGLRCLRRDALSICLASNRQDIADDLLSSLFKLP